MVEVIFISGVNYLDFQKNGSYSFALAHLVKENSEYVKWYITNTSQKCIYDNGAAELGKSINLNDVLVGARRVRAFEVWCPDKLYDNKETKKLTTQFIKMLKPYDTFQLCGIPQGNSFREWIKSYKWMLKNPKISVIALSKYSIIPAFKQKAKTDDPYKIRMFAVRWLHKHNLVMKKLHIAGAVDCHLIDEIKEYRKYPMVRSIDSNLCFKLGVHKIKIDECIKEPEERLNHNIKNLDKEQLGIIQYNIDRVKEVVNNS